MVLSGLHPLVAVASDLSLLLAAVFTVVATLTGEEIRLTRRQLLGVGLSVGVVLLIAVTGVTGVASQPGTNHFTPLLGGILLIVVVQVVVDDRLAFERLLHVVALSSLLLSLLTALNAMGIPLLGTDQVPKTVLGVTFSHWGPVGINSPDGYGMFVVFGGIIWLRDALLPEASPERRVVGVLAFCTCCLGVFATLNRGSFLALMVAVAVISLAKIRNNRVLVLAAIGGIATVGLGGLYLLYRAWAQNVYDIVPRAIIGNLQSRAILIEKGLRLLEGHLWTGIGIGGYQRAVASNIHNTYLSLLVNNGLITLAVFLALLALVFWNNYQYSWSPREYTRTTAIAVLAALSSMSISFLFFVAHYSSAKPMWLIIGIALLPIEWRSRSP